MADVEDARRVAQQLRFDHHVFNFTQDFDRHVVDPYAEAHSAGRTPNPCVECNRHLKFDRFWRRAEMLGFDAIATGHHARVTPFEGGWALRRGRDRAKDQSYVLHMLGSEVLSRLLLPVGEIDKATVRRIAAEAGLRTAAKPDSQDVCFVSKTGGRSAFLGARIPLHPGRLVDGDGCEVGAVDAVELVTVGQRRGLGLGGVRPGDRRYAVSVDAVRRTVVVGSLSDLLVEQVELEGLSWVSEPPAHGAGLEAQMSAHGEPVPATWDAFASSLRLGRPVRRVAPGQSVALYRLDPGEGDAVVGGGIVRSPEGF